MIVDRSKLVYSAELLLNLWKQRVDEAKRLLVLPEDDELNHEIHVLVEEANKLGVAYNLVMETVRASK